MSDFEQFCEDYHRHFTRDPNACVRLGVDDKLDQLPDPSLAERDARVGDARALAARAEQLLAVEKDFDRRLDCELAALSLGAEIHRDTLTWAGRRHAEQCPTAGDEIGDGLFLLFVNDPRPDGERLDNVVNRLRSVPAFLEAYAGRNEAPVTRWLAMEREKLDALPSLFATLRDWARSVAWPDAAQLDAAVETACDAIDVYKDRLAALPAHRELHIGPAAAAKIVAGNGIELGLDELHGVAKRFLRENSETVDELRGRLAPKYGLAATATAAELQAVLNERFALPLGDRGVDGVLDHYEAEREKILAFIEERTLFPVPSDQTMKIVRTPPFMAPTIPAGAMMSPPPFRAGVATSMVYLTLSDELLDEHTQLSVPSMMIHEGIPGHHLQLAAAARHASVIRKHVWAPEQAEGWTTMLEDYMLDVGYAGDFADEQRFIGKRDIARIGARVAIDLFFMTGERGYLDVGVPCDIDNADPFVAAGSLLQAVTGFVPGRVEAELNWYSQERGYPLSYLTGNHLVWELKRDVERAQSGRLDGLELDRAFHQTYLEAGSMPVSFLRRVFEQRGLVASA